MISICFRFDDASAKSDHNLERKVFEVFARFGVPLSVAVIPFAGPLGESVPLSEKNAPHLFDAVKGGVVDVTVHGHSHLHRSSDARGRRTEFAGLAPALQGRLVKEGLDHLTSAFGQSITGFVPPWNTYDAATVEALDEAGFEFISAGFDVYRYGRLPLVPITCTLSTARIAIDRAFRFAWLSPVVVVVFHSDDFVEYRYPPRHDESMPDFSLLELGDLLRWINAKPGLRAEALSELARSSVNGASLRSSTELAVPYRLKGVVSPMLVRSRTWATLPAILWGIARSKLARDADSAKIVRKADAAKPARKAEPVADPVALGPEDGERF